MVTFFTSPLLLGYEMHSLHKMINILNDVVDNFLVFFGVHVTMSFIINVKSFVLIIESYRSPPPITLTIVSIMVNVFEARSPIFFFLFNMCLFNVSYRVHT